MGERKKRSPKFYVAEGVMLRMRESIAYVLDNPDPAITATHTGRRERALSGRTKQMLETLMDCRIITLEECTDLKKKLWDLLDKDEEKRQEKNNGI